MEKLEGNLMKIFNCDASWPLCLHDFTFKNRIPSYYAFRSEKPLTSFLNENYFSVDKMETVRNFKRR